MKQNILITSQTDRKWEKILRRLVFVLISIAVICFLSAIFEAAEEYRRYSDLQKCYDNFFVYFRKEYYRTHGLINLIFHWIFLLFSGIVLIIYFDLINCKLMITEKNIIGRSFFGKREVILPLYQVSSFSITNFFSVISIATASGSVKFVLIENYKEIANVIQKLIDERQENTQFVTVASTPMQPNDNYNDLVKLKELLDNDIITQEEFEGKKKKILGL